jgi:chemotaxis signal transduction protein
VDVLSFHYSEDTYCIKVTDTHEVILSVEALPLPRIPKPFEGVFHHRGNVFSLLNFSQCMSQFSGVICDSANDSQIVIFAEPYHQFALRVPGVLEAMTVKRKDISLPSEKFSSAILDGIVIKGERRYHLISAMKLFLHAGKLISETENERKLHLLRR